MSEQKTAEQAVREQYKVVENAAENVFRAWGDLAATTTEYAFDAVEKSFHFSQEAMGSYRKVYEDSLKSWKNYVQGVSEIFARSN